MTGPRWGGLAFLGFGARRMLASGGGKTGVGVRTIPQLKWDQQKSIGDALAPAMSPSLKGDGDA